jgi:ElaB/YqjD/DUF883 family membrane-anchored ribosome-binding protein
MRKSRDNNNNNKLLYDPNQRQARRLGAFSMEENVDDEDNLEVIEEVSEDVNNDYESNEVENSTQEQESATETTNNNKTQLTKNAKDSVVNVVQDKAKNAVKKKALSFIASNPWVLAVLAGVIVLFIILLLLLGSADDDTDGIYEESCDFNKTMVVYGACGSELSDTYTLKEYVINITKKIAAGRDMDENELKALMIIVKTNALSSGNYNNTDKSIDIDDCDFNNLFTDSDETLELDSLYEEIEGDLYLSTTYSGTIYSLSSSNMLELDEDILESMSSSGGDYEGILDNIYRQSNQDNEEVTVYQNNIYIGDSRTNQTRLYGIIPNESTIYGAGYGYNWFIGNGSFSSDYTNALSGAIDGADSIMDSNSNYNIIINLGINGISTYGAEIFYQEYYELATGKWSNNNIYVVEVGPVDEERSAIRNSTIDEFNENMASLINTSGLSNLMYIDINYNISYYDTEGIHYGYSDYQDIYEQTMNKLSSPFESNANYGIYHLIDNCEFSESTDSDTYTNS